MGECAVFPARDTRSSLPVSLQSPFLPPPPPSGRAPPVELSRHDKPGTWDMAAALLDFTPRRNWCFSIFESPWLFSAIDWIPRFQRAASISRTKRTREKSGVRITPVRSTIAGRLESMFEPRKLGHSLTLAGSWWITQGRPTTYRRQPGSSRGWEVERAPAGKDSPSHHKGNGRRECKSKSRGVSQGLHQYCTHEPEHEQQEKMKETR